MTSINITQHTTHSYPAEVVYTPHESPRHHVVALADTWVDQQPEGDYACPALFIPGGHGVSHHPNTWTQSTNSPDTLSSSQEDWISNMIARYGIHEAVQLIPRAWHIIHDETIRAEIINLSQSEWGALIIFPYPEGHDTDEHGQPDNHEFRAYLRGDTYRLAVVEQNEEGEWEEAGDHPYWAILYTDRPEDETDQGRNYWDEWVHENEWEARP